MTSAFLLLRSVALCFATLRLFSFGGDLFDLRSIGATSAAGSTASGSSR